MKDKGFSCGGGIVSAYPVKDSEVLLNGGEPFRRGIRRVGPATHYRKYEEAECEGFQGNAQVFIVGHLPNSPVKGYVAGVKDRNFCILAGAGHFHDERGELLFHLRRNPGGSPAYRKRFQWDTDFQDAAVIVRTELGDVGSSLRQLGKKTLIFQLLQSFPQGRLPDAQSGGPFCSTIRSPPFNSPVMMASRIA